MTWKQKPPCSTGRNEGQGRPEIALREEKVLVGVMRNWNKKTASPRTEPQRICGRLRPEIALREERVLVGVMRNWNRRFR